MRACLEQEVWTQDSPGGTREPWKFTCHWPSVVLWDRDRAGFSRVGFPRRNSVCFYLLPG